MTKATKAKESAQVRRLREALAREKAKSAGLAKERREAREQQAAAAAILNVISRSPSDAQPVFDAIVRRALRLMHGHSTVLWRAADGILNLAAYSATSKSGDTRLKSSYPRPIDWSSIHGRVLRSRAPFFIPDTEKVGKTFPRTRAMSRARGYRSVIAVPLLRGKEVWGGINVSRKEPGSFSKRQVDLLRTFAEQAVIAIENVRLFNETKEALERQTATAEVLRVISSSPTDTQPVFEAIAQSGLRLFPGAAVSVVLPDGGQARAAAIATEDPAQAAAWRNRFPNPLTKAYMHSTAILERRLIDFPDVEAEADGPMGPGARNFLKSGNKAVTIVPMIRGEAAIGAISVIRAVTGRLKPSQIALLQTFADQAVIAIENVRLFNETKEALEQQTATADVLKVIGRSTFDLQPVFDTLARDAVRLCGAKQAFVFRFDGSHLQVVATCNASDELRSFFQQNPIAPGRGTVAGRTVLEARTLHVHDVRNDPGSNWEAHRVDPIRTVLTIPMIRDGQVLGVIGVNRHEVRPFTDKQVALLETFADQAAIAIENVRLFNETKEALERQTATAEILSVIASSPSDVQPVFDTVARKAVDLCGGTFGVVTRFDGRLIHIASISASASFVASDRIRAAFPAPPSARGSASRCILTREVVHIPDVKDDPEYRPDGVANAVGVQSILAVPLLRAGVPLGSVSVARSQATAFTPHQIALLKTFADQAVIAIENVRLFNETKEALERQTATAEILRVIGGSMTDTQPVFDAIVKNCRSLVPGSNVVLRLLENGMLAARAGGGNALGTVPLDDKSAPGACVLKGAIVHLPDLEAAAEQYPLLRNMGLRMGFRSGLYAPLLHEGRAIGTLSVLRPEAGAFSDKDVALLTTFADQAVIAIENVRLFKELQARNVEIMESLEQQTATSDILRVISSSPADIQPVFDAIAKSAARLCEATDVMMRRAEGDVLRLVSHFGPFPVVQKTIGISGGYALSRAFRERRTLHIHDIDDEQARAEFFESQAVSRQGSRWRTILAVPLVREGAAIGAIAMRRTEVRPFSDKQVRLLETFADQAVIAIENARLFNETQEALARQEAAAQVLRSISESVSDTAPVFTAILDCCNRLIPSIDYVQVQLIEGSGRVKLVDHRFGQVRGAAPGKQEERKAELMAREAAHFPRPLAGSTLERALSTGRVVILADVLDGPDTPPATLVEARRWGHSYSQITVPLMREGRCIGAIEAFRRQLGGFEAKESSLLESFADQAVIAIENVRLFNETKEALERQTATAEILKVIASSPSDVQPVFDAIAASAKGLLGGLSAAVFRVDGAILHLAALTATDDPGDEVLRARFPRPIVQAPGNAAIAVQKRSANWTEDTETDPAVLPEVRTLARARGWRSALAVPMTRGADVVGAINVTRRDPGKFSEHQIGMLKTFADQAVIAIENVRLFNETKEALERQTATAEILKVIASSPSDVQPVFDAIAASARRLLNGHAAIVARRAGDVLELAAFTSTGEAGDSELGRLWPSRITGKGHMGQALLNASPAWVEDIETDPNYSGEFRVGARARGMRSAVSVPMLREGEAIGVISVNRSVPGRFSDHQTNLLKTFADQAVIAIENVRLFNETREALERQTATAEILKVIASSPSDVQPVLEAVALSAARLCEASDVIVVLKDGDNLRYVVHHGDIPTGAPLGEGKRISADWTTGRAALERRQIYIRDVLEETEGLGEGARMGTHAGYRTVLATPLLREGEVLGVITMRRHEVQPFEPRQIELVNTFSDQAVIAIENVRLFKELEARTSALGESVKKLTALGDVGQAISSTLDLETVLKTIATHAVKLTTLDGGSIYEYDETTEQFSLQANERIEPELVAAVRKTPVRKGEGAIGRCAVTQEPEQVSDILDDSYHSGRKDLLVRAGYRAVLAVPLLREGHLLGALQVFRRTPGAFAPEIVELLKTFATQSAMAIQNARLFREIEEKGKQLEEASKHKSQFLASMSHELRTPLNAILGFNEMILGDVYGEVPADMKEPLTDIQTSGKHLLRLINNVLDLAKIEAGRMELALDDYSVHDTVESVRSTLRPLAEAKGLELAVDVPNDIPLARGDGGRITQCLMNLAGNSLKFTKQGSVGISVALTNGTLTYKVQDTGIGIPADKIGGLFTEFKQTDATIASEYGGTGLGLSITKKFIEMHGGRIWAESEPGSGSTFVFEIPLRTGEASQP